MFDVLTFHEFCTQIIYRTLLDSFRPHLQKPTFLLIRTSILTRVNTVKKRSFFKVFVSFIFFLKKVISFKKNLFKNEPLVLNI